MNTHTQALSERKRQLGTRLFRATIAQNPRSKAHAREILDGTRGAKRLPKGAGTELIASTADHYRRARFAKYDGRGRCWMLRGPRIEGVTPRLISRIGIVFPENRPISERLENFKTAHLSRLASLVLGDLSGDISGEILFSESFAEVEARAWTEAGDQYSRRCTYRKTDGGFVITAQAGWNLAVYSRNLAYVHGMLTLAALPVESEISGEEIFRAKWAAKGRGFSVNVHEGFIIRRENGDIAHGKTIGAARSILGRRENERRISRHLDKLRKRLMSGDAGDLGGTVVTIRDSLAAGNCRAGTMAWVDRHFPGRDHATIDEILEIEDQKILVVAACLRALRRSN